MTRQTHTVDVTLRIEVEQGDTFDHEDLARMFTAAYFRAANLKILAQADGEVVKLLSVDATYLDDDK